MERAELIEVLRATGCAVERGGCWFLCDPRLTEAERAKVETLQSGIEDRGPEVSEGWLGIRTGGSSGGVKFARHDERTLSAAVRGFLTHFQLGQVNAVDVLPAYHVSGLMARVRCAVTGGRHVAWDWKALEAGNRPGLERDRPWVTSLVPTQLQRLLASTAAVEWLRGFDFIFVGGGPVWPALAEAAARAGLNLSLSYGMTETAAMIAALRPGEFRAGLRSCGSALPHARVSVGAAGEVIVSGESLFRGYFSGAGATQEFATEDLGQIDERGHLHVFGRRDAAIITGGKKVSPEAVEAELRASGEFKDVAVIGIPDAEWGEVVVACYDASGPTPDPTRAVANLPAHERPKRFVALADWPRNAHGKVNRAELARRVTSAS